MYVVEDCRLCVQDFRQVLFSVGTGTNADTGVAIGRNCKSSTTLIALVLQPSILALSSLF